MELTEDGKFRFTMQLGEALICRKPFVQMAVGCHHPKWWQKLFGDIDFCIADHIPSSGYGSYRESYKDNGLCEIAKGDIARLPSYRDQEARDRRMFPDAIPCKCSPTPDTQPQSKPQPTLQE